MKLRRLFRKRFTKNFAPARSIPRKPGAAKKRSKLLRALGLVIMLLGLLQVSHPSVRGIQKQTVKLLTSPDVDWTPLLNNWVTSGIWQDSFEKHVFNQTAPEIMELPVSGKIERPFSAAENHYGIDIFTKEGALVKASLAGEVIPFSSGPSDRAVALRHSNNRVTIYSGLKNITVEIGQKVPQGKVLGIAEKMLHFEVRVDNRPVDPLPYLSAAERL
ncbi:MAG: M23 family metallopeptidase [Thermoanaerobacteraceae bacterium]|nr:M23 family metallopeptidase [Thermoanaerobacteraceae bacterium]